MELRGKQARFVQRGGWKYHGTILEEDQSTITLRDKVSGRIVILARDSILTLEVLS